jgi:heme ABC exporter ATP-binding subunit CcmA
LHITIRQLAKAYGFLWALKDVSFNLSPGELVALLGPNGAGKTTLLKLLAGLTLPTSGTIEFDGERAGRNSTRWRSKIGFLVPGEHLYENLTVRENLEFFCGLYDKNHSGAALDHALDALSLSSRSKEFVAALSSGMKFRLAIAKCHLLEPELLLLDEPYGVLDGSGVDLLEAFLKRQCERGRIVVVASHHVSRVLQLCSRALILHQGRLTFDEPRRQPWESFTRAFAEFLPHGERWHF